MEKSHFSLLGRRFNVRSHIKVGRQQDVSTSRIFKHFRQQDIKEQVKRLHGEVVDPSKVKGERPDHLTKQFEIDQHSKLPFGMGHDEFIKQQSELVDA
jgi:hypothetical protein